MVKWLPPVTINDSAVAALSQLSHLYETGFAGRRPEAAAGRVSPGRPNLDQAICQVLGMGDEVITVSTQRLPGRRRQLTLARRLLLLDQDVNRLLAFTVDVGLSIPACNVASRPLAVPSWRFCSELLGVSVDAVTWPPDSSPSAPCRLQTLYRASAGGPDQRGWLPLVSQISCRKPWTGDLFGGALQNWAGERPAPVTEAKPSSRRPEST